RAVAELHSDPSRLAQLGSADFGSDLGRGGIVQVNNHQTGVAQNVSVHTDDDDAMRAVELAIGIKRQRALEEIVARLAVEQRAYPGRVRFRRGVAADDQSSVL